MSRYLITRSELRNGCIALSVSPSGRSQPVEHHRRWDERHLMNHAAHQVLNLVNYLVSTGFTRVHFPSMRDHKVTTVTRRR